MSTQGMSAEEAKEEAKEIEDHIRAWRERNPGATEEREAVVREIFVDQLARNRAPYHIVELFDGPAGPMYGYFAGPFSTERMAHDAAARASRLDRLRQLLVVRAISQEAARKGYFVDE